ncbi:MAG: ABC transporter ATP-binding protein [Phycisphaerales bacterium]
MDAFWRFAARMTRYRWTLAGSLACAFVAGSGLGAGILGSIPILDAILKKSRTLPELAEEFRTTSSIGARLIPQDLPARLPSGPFEAVVTIMVALGVLTVIAGAANYCQAHLALTAVYRTMTNIRREVFRRVIHMPLASVVSGGTADVVSRLVGDTTQLAAGMAALISRAVLQIAKGLAGLVAAFIIDWRLAVICIPVAVVVGTLTRTLGKRVRRASRKALAGGADMLRASTEALQGLRVVKVHTTERYEEGRFHRINKEVMRQLFKARAARALASPLNEIIVIFVMGTLAAVATKQIMDGQLEASSFIAGLGALAVAGASLKPLNGIFNEIQAASAAADRLEQLLKADEEAGHDASLPRLPRHAESIRFDNVTFTYPGADTPSLRGVSATIPHAQTVAVVGPNGSGKTTLLSLVPRLFEPDRPTAPDRAGADEPTGRVLIDGHDISTVSIRSLRRQIGVVTQETVLFRATIADNIAYGAENATDDRIRAAARAARAHDFIAALPDGYNTMVGEQGATLSGGQRQRIAIARAILRDPAILILDEATSMIDAESEAHIAEAITDFSRGRTCLIVAHRLSTVRAADRILVMDAGRLIDDGTHDELLRRCAVYRTLARRQLLPPNEDDTEAAA